VRNRFGEQILGLSRAVERRIRDNNITDVDGDKQDEEKHREKSMKQEEAQVRFIEQVGRESPREEERPKGKSAEHDERADVLEDVLRIQLRRELEKNPNLEEENMEQQCHGELISLTPGRGTRICRCV
jgi:hypothetical protein